LATLAELMVNIGADITEFNKEMGALKKGLKNAGEDLQNMGQTIAAGFGAASLAIGAALVVSVKKAADFEQAMSNVNSVMAPDEIKQFSGALEELAIKMGAETKYSGLEAAKGIEELIKAGVSVEDILSGGLKGALSLATAGELELGDAAEIASTALNAFKADGLSVGDAADILAGAANASATSVGELKFGLSAVSAVASAVGMSFKDTTTALSVFAQNGLKGSDAGTSLKTMLMNLIPKTDDQIGLFKDLGLMTEDGANAFFTAEGKMRSLGEIAGTLNKSMAHLTDAQRLSAMETLFGSDAIRAANILYKESEIGVNNMALAMSKVGAADVAAEKMNNVKGRIEELSGAFETAQIAIGNALLPALDKLVGFLQQMIDWFNNLSPGMQEFIAVGAAVTAGVLALVAGFGLLLMFVGGAMTAVSTLMPLFAVLSAAFWPIVAAIAAIVAIGWLLIANWDLVKQFAISAWGAIWEFIKPAVDEIVGFIMGKFEEMREWWYEIWPNLQEAFANIWGAIWAVLQPIIGAIVALMKWAWPFVLEIIKGVWDNIKNIIDAALNIIMAVVGVFAGLFTGNWYMLWENLKDLVVNAFTLLWNWLQLFGFGKILKLAGWFGGKVMGIFKGLWDNVFEATVKVWNKIDEWIKGVWNSIAGGVKGFINMIIRGINRLVDGLNAIKISVPDWVPGIGGKSWSFNIPNVPQLADGGITTGPTLAMIGEGDEQEAVLPLSKLEHLISGNQKETGPIVIPVILDGREIARVTLPYLERDIRNNAGMVF
jgi:TP901 family phage tail tape measure protein